MWWVKPQAMERTAGTPGLVIAVVDQSGSMPGVSYDIILRELKALKKEISKIRFFQFSDGLNEYGPGGTCIASIPFSRGLLGDRGSVLGESLQLIASHISPQRTIVFSDGGADDKGLALSVADRMTGSIDCFFCRPDKILYDLKNLVGLPGPYFGWSEDAAYRRLTRGCGEDFLRQLARRGCGRFIDYHPYKVDIRKELDISTAEARFVRIGNPVSQTIRAGGAKFTAR